MEIAGFTMQKSADALGQMRFISDRLSKLYYEVWFQKQLHDRFIQEQNEKRLKEVEADYQKAQENLLKTQAELGDLMKFYQENFDKEIEPLLLKGKIAE